MKKTILGILGFLLIIGTLFGGNLRYLINWNSFELAGYNLWTLIAIFGGGYLIYYGFRK